MTVAGGAGVLPGASEFDSSMATTTNTTARRGVLPA
jgi:hypothetical protein